VYFTPQSTTQTPPSGAAVAPSSSFPVAALTFATSGGDDDGALNGRGVAATGTPVLFSGRARGATPHTVSPQPLPLAGNRQQVTWQSGGGSAAAAPGFKAAMDRVWARVSVMETALQSLTARPAAA
jgi:hypothetical protein